MLEIKVFFFGKYEAYFKHLILVLKGEVLGEVPKQVSGDAVILHQPITRKKRLTF